MVAALLVVLVSVVVAGASPEPFADMSEKKIASELRRIHKKNKTIESRVAAVSERFLGTPYKLGPLGEGEEGEFDRDPLYSFKAADCTTMIEQVMAMALEPEWPKAVETLNKIRYRDGQVGFTTRNHFPEADWIPANVWAGYLRDITEKIAGANVKQATKMISKREWYTKMSTANIEGFSEPERVKRLEKLRSLGQNFEDQRASVSYMPMDMLPRALALVPSGTIANLVREDQPDKPVLITHQVLLIDRQGQKYVRHAAAGKDVEDVPALEYFYRYFNSKWRLLGLNLNVIRDPAAP